MCSFLRALNMMSSLRPKFCRQQIMSRASGSQGSVRSHELDISVSSCLSKRLLKTLCRSEVIWSAMTDSGMPRTLMLLRLPLLSRSSRCLFISIKYKACEEVTQSNLLIALSLCLPSVSAVVILSCNTSRLVLRSVIAGENYYYIRCKP